MTDATSLTTQPQGCKGCPQPSPLFDAKNRDQHPDYDHDFQPVSVGAPTTQADPHLWKCDGGAPWAIATTAEEARRLILQSEYAQSINADTTIEQVPDDEQFAMAFEDRPEDLAAHFDCPHDRDEEFGECVEDCGEGLGGVTMTVAEWLSAPARKHLETVFGEYDG
jgi:hypothetical protein